MDLSAPNIGLGVGISAVCVAILKYILGRRKIDDDHEIRVAVLTNERLEKVERRHEICEKRLDEAKEHIAQLRERQAKLEAIVDRLSGDVAINVARGLIVCDENGVILEANHGVTLILGWTPEELIGKRVHVLIAHRFREEHEKAFHQAVESGSAGKTRDAFGLTKQGQEVSLTIELASMRESGELKFTARFWRKVA